MYSVFRLEQDLTSGCPEEGMPAGQNKLELVESFDTQIGAQHHVRLHIATLPGSKYTRYTYFIAETWSAGGPEED